MVNIFVSYSHRDRLWFVKDSQYDLIPWLRDALKRDDVRLWYDRSDEGGFPCARGAANPRAAVMEMTSSVPVFVRRQGAGVGEQETTERSVDSRWRRGACGKIGGDWVSRG